jgi:hypothetical protein
VFFVMAGPAIHENTPASSYASELTKAEQARDLWRRRVDGRHKAGHDGFTDIQPLDPQLTL